MDVADLIADARRRCGLTIRQLACRAGTSHSAVAAYESGAKSPNTATLRRLVRACGFEIQLGLRAVDPFEDRVKRGRELVEVLDLAGEFPSERLGSISTRFARS
jgi:transcriptional regulator with XRE-family HTH domain